MLAGVLIKTLPSARCRSEPKEQNGSLPDADIGNRWNQTVFGLTECATVISLKKPKAVNKAIDSKGDD